MRRCLAIGAVVLAQIAAARSALGAQDDLRMVVQPAYRCFELGESAYVRCQILNPDGRQVSVGPVYVTLRRGDWEGSKDVGVYAMPTTSGSRTRWERSRVVDLPLLDVAWSLSRDLGRDWVALTQPGDVECAVACEVLMDPERRTPVRLEGSCQIHVLDSIAGYSPALSAELRRRPRLYQLQTDELPITSHHEYLATREFALRNRSTPIGKNLLFRLASLNAKSIPFYLVSEPATSPRGEFADYLNMTYQERKSRHLGSRLGPAGPDSREVVFLLTALLSSDSGTYARYDPAALLLAEHLLLLDRADEARRWCEAVRTRSDVAGSGAQDLRRMLAKIANGETIEKAEREHVARGMSPDELSRALAAALNSDVSPSGSMPLSEIIYFLQTTQGVRLPVRFDDRLIQATLVTGSVAKSLAGETLGEYLGRVVRECGFLFRQEGGFLIVSRKANR